MPDKPTWEEVGPELLAALDAALPFVAHFLGGWSTHTNGQISTSELHDQMRAAIARAERIGKE